MGWTVWGSNSGWSEIFRTCPDRPWGPPSLLYNGYRVFPGVKSGRVVTLTPHPLLMPWSWNIRAIPLLPYGPYGLYRVSLPVQGWPLPYLKTISASQEGAYGSTWFRISVGKSEREPNFGAPCWGALISVIHRPQSVVLFTPRGRWVGSHVALPKRMRSVSTDIRTGRRIIRHCWLWNQLARAGRAVGRRKGSYVTKDSCTWRRVA